MDAREHAPGRIYAPVSIPTDCRGQACYAHCVHPGNRPDARRHWLAWGGLAAALYLAAAAVSAWLPSVRLLYDGLVPLPPYQWVRAPNTQGDDNKPPRAQTATLELGPQGSKAAEVSTDDEQAIMTFPAGSVAPQPGESSVMVTVTPLDASAVAPAPSGRHFDGNAYRFDAIYAASGKPAVLAQPVTVVLRYAVHATTVLRLEGETWAALKSTAYPGSQQLVANSDRLGIFAPAAP